MKIINGGELYERLKKRSFFCKRISELSKTELESFLKIAIDYVEEENGEGYCHKMPSYHGNGELHIPWNAPKKYRVWERNLSAKEKYELFLEMGVAPYDMHYFMWSAAIDEARKGEQYGYTSKK